MFVRFATLCAIALPAGEDRLQPQVGGRRGCDAAFGVSLSESASGADLGGSRKSIFATTTRIRTRGCQMRTLKAEVEKGSM